MAQAAAPQAARWLHAKSHRLATATEIEAHQAKEDAARALHVHLALRRQGIAMAPVRARPRAS
jgi:hypothetical protein